MKKILFVCLLAGAAALMLAQQPRRVGPGRITGGNSSQAPVYAPFELLSVYPQEAANGEFTQVDPTQLQTLSAEGWQLVSVAPFAYRNEGAPGAANQPTSPPPPLVTQVYLAYFFQRSRLIR